MSQRRTHQGNPFEKFPEGDLFSWMEVPRSLSSAGILFYERHVQLLDYLNFQLALTHRLDEMERAHKTILKILDSKGSAEEIRAIEQVEEVRGARDRLEGFLPLARELLLCNHIDAFQTYLGALLSLIFHSKPETLKSGESVTVEEIFDHASFEELITYIAERRVTALSYKGFFALAEYMENKVGISVGEAEEVERISALIEIRNVYIHNQGRIDRRFLRLFPEVDATGKHVNEIFRHPGRGIAEIVRAVQRVDSIAVEKFGLDARIPTTKMKLYYRPKEPA